MPTVRYTAPLKAFAGFLASWSLYWIGDAFYRFIDAIDVPYEVEDPHTVDYPITKLERFQLATVAALYPIYNWLMIASSVVQDWGGGRGPWTDSLVGAIPGATYVDPDDYPDAGIEVADEEGGAK